MPQRDPRDGRVARNERRFHACGGTVAGDGSSIELRCECIAADCVERVVLTMEEYAFLRRFAGYFAVRPEHVRPADERIIVAEPGRFAIVD